MYIFKFGYVFVAFALLFFSQTTFSKAQNNLCPAAEACPYPGNPGLLWSCHPSDGDGTVSESLCNTAGRVETCGLNASGQPKSWCCPAAGGSWTTNMTACATPIPTPTRSPSPTPTRSPSPTPTRSPSPTPTLNPTPWDVDGNGVVNIIDIGYVIDYYGDSPPLYRRADVNGDGTVTIVDIGLIIDHYDF